MRLQTLRVEGLFGLFDHEISFNLEDRITIIHAPNGFGKTIILKMIYAFFGGTSLSIFRRVEFKRITFSFDDGGVATITQNSEEGDLEEDYEEHKRFAINYKKGAQSFEWDPLERSAEIAQQVPPSLLDRYVPQLRRLNSREWRDRSVGDVVPFAEAVSRYWHLLPPTARRSSPHTDWLDELRESVDCQLIETQRLMTVSKEDRPQTGGQPSLRPAVQTYAMDLATQIAKVLAESATLSQALDRTFPTRLLARMRDKSGPETERELRARLLNLEQRRNRLAKAGLLAKSDEGAPIPANRFSDSELRILSEYADDTDKKLSAYDNILEKIELLLDIINKRFQFKTMNIDRQKGIVFKDTHGTSLELESLSSGEQHELILMYDLLFKTKKDTLLLIDEPEISLHVAWQKRFLIDLKRIVGLTTIDVVLSTHSPQLVGGNLRLVVPLKAPRNVKSV